MMLTRSYRIALVSAIMLHLSIVALLLFERTTDRPVLVQETRNEAGQIQPQPSEKPQESTPIQAVSVDSQEVMKTVNHLKEERVRQKQAEENRQRALNQQAELARKQRIEEQKHLEQLKNEEATIAIARKKKMEEEQQHLKELAKQKQEQEKKLAEMKQQQIQMQKQQEEAQKLAALNKKKADELAKANQEKANQEKAAVAAQKANQEKEALAKAALAQKQQAAAAAAQQAALDAANTARVAGEVDKYKALIINAISQQWILPQNADSTMSSQFRIRLAPNGSVLEVSLTRSSGDPILDRSAQSAIYKASPLPVPNDPTTFNLFRDISLTVRPVNARG